MGSASMARHLCRQAILLAAFAALVPPPAHAAELHGAGAHVLATWQPLDDRNHPVRGALLGGGALGRPFALAPGLALVEAAVVGPNGDAAVVWSQLKPTGDEDYQSRLFVTVGRAGGRFELPVGLTSFQDEAPDAAAAVSGRGDVLVTWTDDRLRLLSAFRPAGGGFGPPTEVTRELGGAELALEDSGAAVAVANARDADPSRPSVQVRAVRRSPDGRWGSQFTVSDPADDESHLTGVAATAEGQAIAVWTVGDPYGGDSVKLAESVPGGGFTAPVTVATRDHPNFGVVGGPAAAAANGRAAVAWFSPHGMHVAAREAPGPFGAAELVAPIPDDEDVLFPELVDLALGPDGDAGLVWIDHDAVRAAHRPAGAAFGRPVRLGRAVATNPPRAPSVAIGPDRRALVAWEEFDLERVHQLTRTLGPDGAGGRREFASSRPWVRQDAPSGCFPRRGRTVARNGRAHVFRMRVRSEGDLLFGCLLASGAYEELSFNAFRAVDLTGPLVAFAEETCRGTDGCSTELRVRDLRSFAGISRLAELGPGEHPQLGSIRLKPNGAVAWIACPGDRGASFGSNRLCRRPGVLARVYAMHASVERERLLAVGRRIDPASLRLSGSLLTWRDGRRVRRARLR